MWVFLPFHKKNKKYIYVNVGSKRNKIDILYRVKNILKYLKKILFKIDILKSSIPVQIDSEQVDVKFCLYCSRRNQSGIGICWVIKRGFGIKNQ